MRIIRSLNAFPSQIEELILKQPKLSPHHQLEVSREGHRSRKGMPEGSDPRALSAQSSPLYNHGLCAEYATFLTAKPSLTRSAFARTYAAQIIGSASLKIGKVSGQSAVKAQYA